MGLAAFNRMRRLQKEREISGRQTEQRDAPRQALATKSDEELRALAKEAKIKGWNNMKRETLIDRLR